MNKLQDLWRDMPIQHKRGAISVLWAWGLIAGMISLVWAFGIPVAFLTICFLVITGFAYLEGQTW